MSRLEEILENKIHLEEDEYLLKFSKDGDKMGFLSKMTQKGELPIGFKKWRTQYFNREELPIKLHTEKFSKGWKLAGFRNGESRDWVQVMNPKGFILEIYLSDFMSLLKDEILINYKLTNFAYKWQNKKLIRENG